MKNKLAWHSIMFNEECMIASIYINAQFYLGNYEHDNLCSARFQYNVHEKSLFCIKEIFYQNDSDLKVIKRNSIYLKCLEFDSKMK